MAASFDFYRNVESCEADADARSLVVGVNALRLRINPQPFKPFPQIGQHCVSARVLEPRLRRLLVAIEVPVLAPVRGTSVVNVAGEAPHFAGYERREISRVRGTAIVECLDHLPDAARLVVVLPALPRLTLLCVCNRGCLAVRGESPPFQGSTRSVPCPTLSGMAMGTSGGRTRQATMWGPTADLPKSAGHPFYERLNRVLDEAGFDAFVEAQCASFYADGVGRPSLAPGRYFRLLLLGYFEGLDSERAITWRAADSLSIRTFLDFALHEAPPDHSTLSRTRRLIDLETHQAVFTWVLQRLADATLVVGRTVGIDATTLEANAAMRSIVRRDTGESYDAFLTRLAEASGLSTPTRAELARFDRTRKKKGSNADWTHPHDPDAKITKMKDGRTHLAHTAEHAVDLDKGAIVGVTVQDASAGDTTTLVDTLVTAAEQVEAVGAPGIAEVVADKGYHINETMVGFAAIGVRCYVSEPDRGRRHWKGQAAARNAVYANRRRIRGARGKGLLLQRGELLERPNAHLYETGRMRRVHLRGHPNILKRLLVQVCGVNLGLLLRHLTGIGTPRSLQGRASALVEALIGLLSGCWGRLRRFWAPEHHDRPDSSWDGPATRQYGHAILD